MTQEAFETLVNLYLDGEIESDDCCRLMEEVERNPQRRKEFDDHCRLHSAVQLALFSRSVSQRPEPSAPSSTAKPAVHIDQLQRSKAIMAVVQTARRRQYRRQKWMRANQLMAMAACFGLIFAVVMVGSWESLPRDAHSFLGTATEAEVVSAFANSSAATEDRPRGITVTFETAPEVIFGEQPTVPAAHLADYNGALPHNEMHRLLTGGQWPSFGPDESAFSASEVTFTGDISPAQRERLEAMLQALGSAEATPLQAVPVPMSTRSGFTIDLSGLATEGR